MSSYTNPAVLSFSPLVPTGFSVLVYGFIWYCEWDDETLYVDIPALMVTDGMSIPWFASWMFRKYDSRTLKGSIAHDYLYKFRTLKSTVDSTRVCTRKEADQIFYEAILLGCRSSNRIRRFLWKSRCKAAYYALRAFGSLAWNRHR